MARAVTAAAGEAIRVFVLPSAAELARAAAGRIWGTVRERSEAARRAGRDDPRIAVALSGGRTPREALALLASAPYRDRFPWKAVHFFQVDERWVAPSDPASNQRMIRESLIRRAPVPAGNFHPVDTSRDGPQDAARRYEGELRSFFGRPRGGVPRFDLVLLGVGADGHTASLFPGSGALEEGEAWAVGTAGGDPAVDRITLTLPALNGSALVLFLADGARKAQVVRDLLAAWGTGAGRGPRFPASLVRPRRGRVVLLVSAEAASLARAEGRIPG